MTKRVARKRGGRKHQKGREKEWGRGVETLPSRLPEHANLFKLNDKPPGRVRHYARQNSLKNWHSKHTLSIYLLLVRSRRTEILNE